MKTIDQLVSVPTPRSPSSGSASKSNNDSAQGRSEFRDAYDKAGQADRRASSESREAATAKGADKDRQPADAAGAKDDAKPTNAVTEADTLNATVETSTDVLSSELLTADDLLEKLSSETGEIGALLKKLRAAEARGATSEIAEASEQLGEAAGRVATDESSDDIVSLLKLLAHEKQAEDPATTDPETEVEQQAAPEGDLLDTSLLQEEVTMQPQIAATANNASAADDDGAVVYRFERQDGKGRPLDMLGKDGSQNGDVDDGGDTPTKIENVTVLDARRYVAPETTTNTSNIIATMTGDKTWAGAMKAAGSTQLEQINHLMTEKPAGEVNTLKIQLQPAHLGQVTATMRLKGDELTVQLRVENAEAFRQLSHDADAIIKTLKQQGYSVDQVSVQLSPATQTERAVAQTAAGQQTDGQQLQGGSGQSGQGEQRDNQRAEQGDDRALNWGQEEVEIAALGDAGSRNGARAGQVYL